MPPRKFVLITMLLLLPALLAVAACGGDDDDDDTSFQPGRLTDPEEAPTATPWDSPPEVVVLDPDNIQPLPPDNPTVDGGGNGDGGGEPTEEPQAGEPGVCGETYTVEAGDLLVDIGEKCGVDWNEILELNPDIDPAALSIGQVLIMPSPDDGGEGEAEDDAEAE